MEDYKNLLTKTAVGELKKQLKEGGMRGYSKMKKSEIISLLVTKKTCEREAKAKDPVSVLEEVKVDALPEEVKPVKAEKAKRKRPKAVEAKAVEVEAKQVARDA